MERILKSGGNPLTRGYPSDTSNDQTDFVARDESFSAFANSVVDLALDKENIVLYSCTNYRNKDSETSLSWNDKDLKIKWPIKNPILSERDSKNNPFKKFNFLG